jgi:putative transcriptional regulator
MPALSDPRLSGAVLIGAGSYLKLPPLPAVAGNITALARVLSDPSRWGIAAYRCRLVHDPETPVEMHDALRATAALVEPDGLLLVYYGGHGLIDPRTGELHLAVGRSDPETVYADALPYGWLRRAVLDSRASRRVVILDCCYGGRALDSMGPRGPVSAEVEIDQACVLVAAPAHEVALAPAGEPYTAFTGVLLDLLSHGVPGKADPLDLTSVYDELVRVQRSRARPLPQLLALNGGERIPLVRNAAASGNAANPYVGQVFVGAATLADPDLAGAELAVLAHSPAQGAIGVRLDRPTTRSPADLIGEQRAAALEVPVVFHGGPVRDIVILLVRVASDAPRPPGFTPVSGNLGALPLTADLPASVEAGYLFVGYLGWRPGQLESEVARGELVAAGVTLADRLADGWRTR